MEAVQSKQKICLPVAWAKFFGSSPVKAENLLTYGLGKLFWKLSSQSRKSDYLLPGQNFLEAVQLKQTICLPIAWAKFWEAVQLKQKICLPTAWAKFLEAVQLKQKICLPIAWAKFLEAVQLKQKICIPTAWAKFLEAVQLKQKICLPTAWAQFLALQPKIFSF